MLSYRPGARGFVVRELQVALEARLGALEGGADGIYGRGTATAVMEVQRREGLQVSGFAGEAEFEALGIEWPEAFTRCLQLTSQFEGTDVGDAVGPRDTGDSAGVTVGLVGFTSYNGELQKLLQEVAAANGVQYQRIAMRTLGQRGVADLNFACMSGKGDMFAAWALAPDGSVRLAVRQFIRELGATVEMHEAQLGNARRRYWRKACEQCAYLGLTSVRAQALLFDVAVQNGGLTAIELADVLGNGKHSESELMWRAVDELTKRLMRKKSAFVQDVRSRKSTIAAGHGTVHGREYRVEAYAL